MQSSEGTSWASEDENRKRKHDKEENRRGRFDSRSCSSDNRREKREGRSGIRSARKGRRSGGVETKLSPSEGSSAGLCREVPALSRASETQRYARRRGRDGGDGYEFPVLPKKNPISIVKRDGTEWSPPSPWRGKSSLSRNKKADFVP